MKKNCLSFSDTLDCKKEGTVLLVKLNKNTAPVELNKHLIKQGEVVNHFIPRKKNLEEFFLEKPNNETFISNRITQIKNIAVMVIGIIYALVSIFIVFKSTGIKAFYNTETLQFPDIWLTATYVLGFLVIFPVIISIINTTSEFSNKTSRQHIIDGLSRNEFHLSKLISIFIITSVFTMYLLLICLILGFSNGGYTEFFGRNLALFWGTFYTFLECFALFRYFVFYLKRQVYL